MDHQVQVEREKKEQRERDRKQVQIEIYKFESYPPTQTDNLVSLSLEH
jgi:hypothetical protein